MQDDSPPERGFGQPPTPLTTEYMMSIEPLIVDRATHLSRMTEEDIGRLFDWCDFRDAHGHPLTHSIDFLALVRLARPKQDTVAPALPAPIVRKLPPGETTVGRWP